MFDRRQGCLQGLLELFLLDSLFNWLQRQFGFGKGCLGIPCGVILLCIFIFLACSIFSNTNWLSIIGR
ncbi:MAG: hypothetical protein WCF84_14980 [Anaerolineae bacterium]